jgi:uncharacterized protein
MPFRHPGRSLAWGQLVSAALFTCDITHVRTQPIRRAFRYGSYLWLVDLDDLPRVARPLRPLARFRAGDHLGDPAASIRANVDSYLARHGIDLAGGRVLMLASARVLGYVFNPLSVFWCHAADGTLAAVVAEVHNTYGERHAYLLHPDSRGRAEAAKKFYVSPFLPVAGRYRMRLAEPADTLRLGVVLDFGGTPTLIAAVHGQRHHYSTWRLLRCAVRYPWVTGQVTALIRWQAIRLLARRQPIIRRPIHQPQEGVQ